MDNISPPLRDRQRHLDWDATTREYQAMLSTADLSAFDAASVGLDPVGELQSGAHLAAFAQAVTLLHGWGDHIVQTSPGRLLACAGVAYHTVLAPFEMWLDSDDARSRLASATIAVRWLGDLVDDAVCSRVGVGVPDLHIERLAALRRSHLAEVSRSRPPVLFVGESLDDMDIAFAACYMREARWPGRRAPEWRRL